MYFRARLLAFSYPGFFEKNLRPEYSVFKFGGGGSTLFFCKNVAQVAPNEVHAGWFGTVECYAPRRLYAGYFENDLLSKLR